MIENNNGNGKLSGFFMGALMGAAVGAGVALLVAPRTGKEARSWLARRTRQIRDRTTSAVRRETKGIAEGAAKEFANVQELIR